MLPMGCQADPDSFQMAFLQSTPEYPHPLLQSLGASEREWMLQGYYIRPFWAFQQGWERFLARGSNSTYEFLSPGGRICLANSSSYFLLKDELAPGWWGTSKWELVALGECKKDTTLAPAFCASAQTTNFGWDRGLVSLQRGTVRGRLCSSNLKQASRGASALCASSEKDMGLEGLYETYDVSHLAISQSCQLQKERGSNAAFTRLEVFKGKAAMVLAAAAWKYFSILALSGSTTVLRRPEAYQIFQLFINFFVICQPRRLLAQVIR